MDEILIVSGTETGRAALKALMDNVYAEHLGTAENSAEARVLLAAREYDLVIINTPLSDEFGDALAAYTAKNTRAGVILLAKGEHAARIDGMMREHGVLVLEKPLNRTVFQYTIRAMAVAERRLQMMEQENQRLQNKIEETRLVTRAKLVLMDCLKMSEENAHHYIEHQAMDRHCTRLEIAQSIIRTYHN